jgi:cytochrome c oxidase assembly protein subunit 15
MNLTPSLIDLSPALRLGLLGLVVALVPSAWWWWRHRAAGPGTRLRALTLLTLFLTFDLVLFGAFTRLSDSGLGCPDWPGCYGNATPLGAHPQIDAAQAAMPTGPVTHSKAWVEMVHRYLAIALGVLVTLLAVASWVAHWRARRRGDASAAAPWWASATLLWCCLQGAFGAWTVTMKLYPAIVTAHLLGGIGLLVLLAAQSEAQARVPLVLSRGAYRAVAALALLCIVQIALGGWVSTNYAVLACADFPRCQGQWWPSMDFAHGFTLLRPLGMGADGAPIPFPALTAIHLAHRLGALAVLGMLGALVWRLLASGMASQRRWAAVLIGVAVWQFASGVSNVLLGWPLAAAIAHTGGAAVLVTLLTVMLVRAHQAREARPVAPTAPVVRATAA